MFKAVLFLLFATTISTPNAIAQAIHAVTETSAESYAKDGKVAGPATKIVELSLQKAGLTRYRIDLYPWARSYDIALHEPNVLIYQIIRSKAREPLFKWVGEIQKQQFHLYKLKENTAITVTSLADAKNYVIGVSRDDVRQQYLQR